MLVILQSVAHVTYNHRPLKDLSTIRQRSFSRVAAFSKAVLIIRENVVEMIGYLLM